MFQRKKTFNLIYCMYIFLKKYEFLLFTLLWRHILKIGKFRNHQKFCFEKTFDLIYCTTFLLKKCIFSKNDVIVTSQYRNENSVITCSEKFQGSLYILFFDNSNSVRFYSEQTHTQTIESYKYRSLPFKWRM